MYLVPLTKFLLYCKVCNIIWLYFKQNPTKRSKHNISHLLSSASGLLLLSAIHRNPHPDILHNLWSMPNIQKPVLTFFVLNISCFYFCFIFLNTQEKKYYMIAGAILVHSMLTHTFSPF